MSQQNLSHDGALPKNIPFASKPTTAKVKSTTIESVPSNFGDWYTKHIPTELTKTTKQIEQNDK